MSSLAELASGPVILAPRDPRRRADGHHGVTRGRAARPAEAALAPGDPIRVAPARMATARLAVYAGHVRRFSISVSPVTAQVPR